MMPETTKVISKTMLEQYRTRCDRENEKKSGETNEVCAEMLRECVCMFFDLVKFDLRVKPGRPHSKH